MRILQNILYVTSLNAYLHLDGENIVIRKEDNEIGRVPLHNLEGVVTFGYTGASPALMGACAKRNISLCFLSSSGRFLARVSGETRGNVILRKNQYRISDQLTESTLIARHFVSAKIHNSRWIIERAIRDHGMRIDTEKLISVSKILGQAARRASEADSLESLRGIEGEAAQLYYSVFDDLILQQKEDFVFCTRSRRPPLDKVNAMLSFLYTLLAQETGAALETVGLDPYVGFLHRDRPGRMSLALDLMEEFRAVLADRLVLTMINKRYITSTGFIEKENGAVLMDDETRRTIINTWQTRKQETIVHPFLQVSIPWGLVPYAQALLLSRHIRGDLEGYPPFFWK